MESSIQLKSKFPNSGETIFSVMTALANEHGAVNLSQGFPDFDTPKDLIKLASKYMKLGKNQYAPMPGVLKLRQEISKKINRLYSADYNPETEITVVAGATLGLFCAFQSILSENDEVVIFEPAYDSYEPAIRLAGAKPIYTQIDLDTMTIDW
ncbi:MAG: aminotransferase class I/II-fold pyridoxal phosphate-dependent enzyme, partial [Bacteroidia bacterium]|nr:aminotransferase class I/II-fold pyridoxal phosphate-dependent enzyme [Bacteroidia bacterium]